MIKAVLFDMGGVIASQDIFDRRFNAALKKFFGKTGIDFSNLGNSFVLGLIKRIEKNEITNREFWMELAKGLNRTYDPSLEHVFEDMAKKSVPRKGMVNIVKKIRSRGIITGVLSNVWETIAKHNYNSGYYKIFDYVFLSHELKMRKPEKEIFRYALNKLSLKPREVVFIDDKKHNIIAAEALGMRGLLYTNTNGLKRDLRNLGIKI